MARKNAIVEKLIEVLPPAEHLFGGATATECGQPLLLDLLNDLSRIHKGAEVYIYDTADHGLFADFDLRDIDYHEQINFNGLVWHYFVEYRTNVPAIIIECDIL